jgi:hypothetical protein
LNQVGLVQFLRTFHENIIQNEGKFWSWKRRKEKRNESGDIVEVLSLCSERYEEKVDGSFERFGNENPLRRDDVSENLNHGFLERVIIIAKDSEDNQLNYKVCGQNCSVPCE